MALAVIPFPDAPSRVRIQHAIFPTPDIGFTCTEANPLRLSYFRGPYSHALACRIPCFDRPAVPLPLNEDFAEKKDLAPDWG
jgi:hypothetical protein